MKMVIDGENECGHDVEGDSSRWSSRLCMVMMLKEMQ